MAEINGYGNTLATGIANYIFNLGSQYNPGADPSTFYVGLYNTVPDPAGVGAVEVTGTGYARVATTGTATVANSDWNEATLETGAVIKTSNKNDIVFPTSGGSWGLVTGYGIFTASSGGNPLIGGGLTVDKTIETDTVAVFLAGDLIINTVNQAV